MDKLKVFISSSMTELNDERAVVKQALDERNMESVWFEGFGAQPNTPQQAYLAAVEACDVYLGLFWNRYSAATEEEYRKANELQKPCFIYVKNFNVRRDDDLTKLLGEIGQKHVYKMFSNVVELGGWVGQDIIAWLVTEYRRVKARAVTPPVQQAATAAEKPGDETVRGPLVGGDSASYTRLMQLIRTLPHKRVSFADRQAIDLIQAARASDSVRLANVSLGLNHSVVVLDVANKGRTERVVVQFVNGELKAGKRKLAKKLDAIKSDVAYIVPSIPSPNAPKLSSDAAQVVSLADFYEQLKKLGL